MRSRYTSSSNGNIWIISPLLIWAHIAKSPCTAFLLPYLSCSSTQVQLCQGYHHHVSQYMSSLLLPPCTEYLTSIYSKLVLKLDIFGASTFQCHDYCYLLYLKLFSLNWVEDTFTGTISPFHSLLLHTLILMVCFCFTNHSSFNISKLPTYILSLYSFIYYTPCKTAFPKHPPCYPTSLHQILIWKCPLNEVWIKTIRWILY